MILERKMQKYIKKGYAKINLHLDVTGILDNGFHRVATVMQSVSLCDTVTLTKREDDKITISCDVPGVPCNESNLAARATALYLERTGIRMGAHIDIEKHIPMAAGLAGGSADAAATLLAINEACGEPLSLDELCAIASELGSDVPFCLVGGAALGEGKGDVLTPLPKMPDCTLLVACGGEGVSTPWAYRELDRIYGGFLSADLYAPKDTAALMSALGDGDLGRVASNIYNVFEAPVLSCRPVAASLKDAMLQDGAIGAMMSGSGPSVFGIFEREADALSAAENIGKMGVTPHICKPI